MEFFKELYKTLISHFCIEFTNTFQNGMSLKHEVMKQVELGL